MPGKARFPRTIPAFLLASLSGLLPLAAAGKSEPAADKIPITTTSAEARAAFLEGRTLAEQLRGTDACARFERAIAKDPSFALAYFNLATTAGTNKEFFDALKKAVSLADKASPAEQDMILGLDAGSKGDLVTQKQRYTHLVEAFPKDERAQMLIAGYYFARQDYQAAIDHYTRATAINPDFNQAYNQLGYAYRFLARYPEAEKAFRKYIELIPNDPNPYDSYAEFLMKTGRFQESIKSYEKALAVDPHFTASYVGIANNQMFLGSPEEARKTLARLTADARTPGERRQALFWTAVSYLHEGNTAKALEEIGKERAVAVEIGDRASETADLDFMGLILLETGKPDEAVTRFDEAAATMAKADVPAPVKEAQVRNRMYLGALAAFAKGDLAAARTLTDSYGKAVAAKNIPFELRQQHELLGRLALAAKDYAKATQEFTAANQQDPRILYQAALAIEGQGDRARAKQAFTQVAEFNGLNGNLVFVRAKARDRAAELAAVASGRN